jgi:hypothetical protein
VLKHNDHSRDKDPGSHDGTFSLATTIIKGKGQDSIAPAVQFNTEWGSAQITAALNVLHELCQWIMPKSISKFENEMWEFHCKDKNIVSFGGLEPGNTSCQFNVSSLGNHLTKHMGKRQERTHNDKGDDPDGSTCFLLFIHDGPSALKILLYIFLSM